MEWILVALALIGLVTVLILMSGDSGPSTCPNCKKEYEKAEPWSYTEYSWGLRCPHCKYEFDITP
jgi:transposase-like protein